MTSAIDTTKPVYGNPTTQSVRDNFSAAYTEITDLQAKTAQAPFLPIAGGLMNGTITMPADPVNPYEVATKKYVDDLAFGDTGGIGEAPTDEMFYARGTVTGGGTWSKQPQFESMFFGPNSTTKRFSFGSDATYNFWKLNDTQNYIRYNRTSNAIEIVANNTVVLTLTGTSSAISNFAAINTATVSGTAPTINLTSATTADEYIYWLTGTTKRWALGADAGATGLGIYRYDGAGAIVDKPFSVSRTTGQVTLINDLLLNAGLTINATSSTPARFDTRGNFGIGIAPPTGQTVATTLDGGWGFSWGFTANNYAANLYYDGSNWRYKKDGRGSQLSMVFGGNIFAWQTAPSGTAGSVATLTTRMSLDADNGRLILGTATDPLRIDVANGNYARALFNVQGARFWSAGVFPSGNFCIADESAPSVRLTIEPNGNVTVQQNLSANYLYSAGDAYVANNLQVKGLNGINFANTSNWFRFYWESGFVGVSVDNGGAYQYLASTAYVSNNYVTRRNASQLGFDYSNGWYYGATDGGTWFYASVAFTNCDERIKTDVAPTKVDALAAMCAIPVHEWRAKPEVIEWLGRDKNYSIEPFTRIGITAQRVKEIAPDLVYVADQSNPIEGKPEGSPLPDDLLQCDLTRFVPYLVRAIQQLTERMETLEAK